MELHPLDRQAAMAQPHDLAVLGFGGDGEALRQRCALDDQRVITRSHETNRYFFEDPFSVVTDARRLAVHDPAGADHLSAERLADRLVAEADAENRRTDRGDGFQADARLVRRAWARRDDQMRRLQPLELAQGDLVVAEH